MSMGNRPEAERSLCGKCGQYTCPWIHEGKPVPGWEAEPSTLYPDGWCVHSCRLFIPLPDRKTKPDPDDQAHRIIWMETSRDRFRLPIRVAFSAADLARQAHVRVNNVQSAVSRYYHGRTQDSRFISVYIRGEDD